MTAKRCDSVLGQAAHGPVGRSMGYDEALFSLAHEYENGGAKTDHSAAV